MDHVTQITLSLKELIILKFQNFNIITNTLDSGNLKNGANASDETHAIQQHWCPCNCLPTVSRHRVLFSSMGALVIVYQLRLHVVRNRRVLFVLHCEFTFSLQRYKYYLRTIQVGIRK